MFQNKVDLYKTATISPMPLIVLFFSLFQNQSRVLVQLFFVLVDILISASFYIIQSTRSDSPLSPDSLALIHLYNPLTLMAVLGQNLGLIGVLVQSAAIAAAVTQRRLQSTCLSGLSTYLEFLSIPLIFPVAILASSNTQNCEKELKSFMIKSVSFTFILFILSGLFVKLYLNSDRPFAFIYSAYLSRIHSDDLRPNSGLFWYLFTQVFSTFRSLFKVTIPMVLLAFWAPVSMKYRKDPLFMIFLHVAIQSLLKPYPSAADYSFLFTLLAMQAHLFERTRVLFFAVFIAAGIFVFQMKIWRYWIEVPGFNVNFYYIFTLAWNIIIAVIVLEMTMAQGMDQLHKENPELLDDKYKEYKVYQR